MEQVVYHLVRPIVAHPDDVNVHTIEGEAVTILELSVHEDDRSLFQEDDGRTLRSIRTIVSAAAGQRKATVDLVDDDEAGDEE